MRIVFERFVEWVPTQVVGLIGESAHLSFASCTCISIMYLPGARRLGARQPDSAALIGYNIPW
jgi:hypothetical protein